MVIYRSVKINKSPSEGLINISPSSSRGLTTKYAIICSSWYSVRVMLIITATISTVLFFKFAWKPPTNLNNSILFKLLMD